MMDAAARIPDAYVQDRSALGTAAECVASLEQFRAAGAEEIATYGSTPQQNAKLIAWRGR